MKIKSFKNGWEVSLEKNKEIGYKLPYMVRLRDSAGELRDKIACDSYSGALSYYKSFCKIANNGV